MNEHSLASGIASAYCAGRKLAPGPLAPLVSPNTLAVVAQLSETPAAVVAEVVQAASAAYQQHRRATPAQRSQWLSDAADALSTAADEVVALIVQDVGKPRRVAAGEVQRSIDFVRACAREVLQIGGEVLPLEGIPAGAGHFGFTRRVPLGVVAAITPFNAPANLLCQKVAPALAMGNAVIAKPHPAATRAALRIAQAFSAGGLPDGLFSVVTGDKEAATSLVGHDLVRAVSFTGGNRAAEALARAAGTKKFVAELGSNAANVVLADADLADAAKRIAAAAFEASGQQCVSAQRIIVESAVHDRFVDLFVSAACALKVGPAEDPTTDIGPMVSQAQADRVMRIVRDTVAQGGKFVLEPKQQACTVTPGIIVGAPRTAAAWCEEAFGPIAVVERAADAKEALALANDSEFGLQGAVFTRDLNAAFLFSEEFDVGSLWINEASRYRLDIYPFGGSKKSGSGREGVRYAMEELSQLKFTGMRLSR
jgi:acyl-CoA reductase-like NAD-dependent aldehyde dehydrogenase